MDKKRNHISPCYKSLVGMLMTFLIGSISANALAQTNRNTSNIYVPQNNQVENSKGFGGFYTQAALGYQSFAPNVSNTNYTAGATSTSSSTQVSSSQSMTGTITAGYDFSVNSGFLLGLGAEFSPMPSKSASISGATVGSSTIPASSYKVNNTYNLFISPIFPVDKSTAIYAKAGYSRANISTGPNLDSLGYTGYSVGLGYKTFVSGNFYAYIEGNYYNYGKVTGSGSAIIPQTSTSYSYSNSSNATSYNLLYGIGLHF